MDPAAHIAGVPLEETLLALGGPTAIYATLLAAVAAARGLRGRLRANTRHRAGAAG